MKKILLVFICLIVFVLNTSSGASEIQPQKQKINNLESSNLEYSLGIIEKDRIIRQRVIIRNKLNGPLAVNEARSTCECIESFIEPQIVEPDGTFDVEIRLDTTGMPEGDIEEVIYILSENIDYQIIRLVISASVIDTK